MTQTINALFNQDFAANQLNVLYNDLLDDRLAAGWELGDTRTEMGDQFDRHTQMLNGMHNIGVTLDWIQGLMTEAFGFLAGAEGDKFVRNLYLVRLAVDDLFVGAGYHDLKVGELIGPDALVELLDEVRPQVQRDILPRITKDGTYTLEEARAYMNDLWHFATCGLVGTAQMDLAYGADVLLKDGRYQKPRTLINTGDLADSVRTETAVAVLEGLL